MDLSLLTPEQLSSLKQQLGLGDSDGGRSPLRPRQLHDLRLQPTATDPRPLFMWSAESPRDQNVTRTHEFPKLLWDRDTLKEITVYSREEESEKLAQGYQGTPPTTTEMDSVDVLAEALADLSPEEREAILADQQKQRLKVLQDRIAALPESQLEVLLAQATKPKRIKKSA